MPYSNASKKSKSISLHFFVSRFTETRLFLKPHPHLILSSTSMLLSTHLAAGLIISKLTGNYNVSLLGSVIMDLDHLIAYYRTGILLKFKKILIATTGKADIGLPQRNFFHNIFFCLLVSAIVAAIDFSAGLIFGAAYMCHLVLDALDSKTGCPF